MWADDKEIDRAVSALLRAQLLNWLAFALAIFVLFAVLDLRTAIGLTALSWAIHWHLGVNARIAHNRSLILAGLQMRDRDALGRAIECGGGNFLEHLKVADAEYEKVLDSPFSQSDYRHSASGTAAAFAGDLALIAVVAAGGIWARDYFDWLAGISIG